MSDSPKCPIDLKAGLITQTYRVWGSGGAKYKCMHCSTIFKHEDFKPVDFKWKDAPQEWNLTHGLSPNRPTSHGDIKFSREMAKIKKK